MFSESVRRILGKFALDGDFHVAAAFSIGDVGNSGFAADINPKFQGDFADFGDRHILESSQGVGCVRSDGSLNGLKCLRQLILGIKKHTSAFRIVAFSRISREHHIRSWTGVFDRFNINGGAVFESDWGELSHCCITIAACQLQFNFDRDYSNTSRLSSSQKSDWKKGRRSDSVNGHNAARAALGTPYVKEQR